MPVITAIAVSIAGPLFAGMTGAGIGAATAASIINVLAPMLAYGALSMGIGYASRGIQGLIHKQERPLDPGRTVAVRQPAAPRRVIYGRARVSGVCTFADLVGWQKWPNILLHFVFTITGHRIQSVDCMYLDGVAAPRLNDGNNWNVSGKYQGRAYFEYKLGSPGEAAFPVILGAHVSGNPDPPYYYTFPDSLWTANHRQDGCASIHWALFWDPKVYPNGAPNATWDVHGALVYDPRNDTTAYSENPALCIRDYLTNSDYGLGCSADQIDDDSVSAAADVCDEDVALKAGGSEKRYTCNGSFLTDSSPQEILNALQASMAGYVIYTEGKWRLIAGVYTDPVLTLTDDDLRGPISVNTLRSKRDLCNVVKGTFFYPTNNWQQTDVPAQASAIAIAEDSGITGALVGSGIWTLGTIYDYTAPPNESRDVVVNWAPSIAKWITGHAYVVGDYAVDAGVAYYCKSNHTSGSTNEPGKGASWTTYWNVATGLVAGAKVFVCTQSHTAAADNEPLAGANWEDYWQIADERIEKDIHLPFTVSPSMAQRIFAIELQRVRRQITAKFPCKLSGWQLQPGDVFKYSHDHYSWDEKLFQVIQADLVVDSSVDAPTIGVDLQVQEIDPAVYAWDPYTQEEIPGEPEAPNFPIGGIPGGGVIAYGPGLTYTSNGGTVAYPYPRVKWTWDYTGDNAIRVVDPSGRTGPCDEKYTPQGSQMVNGLTEGNGTTLQYTFYPYYDTAETPLGQPQNLAVSALAGGSLTGTYKWVITPIDGYGVEGIPSDLVTLSLSSEKGVLTWDPMDGASGGYNVYRTAAGTSSPFKFVANVTINFQQGPTYTDNIADGSLGSANPPTEDTTKTTFSMLLFGGAGGEGSPAWAQNYSTDGTTLRSRWQDWLGNGRIPLAVSPIDIAMPAQGGSGGGGGGGDGGCLLEGMFVRERDRGVIRAEEVRIDDFLWSKDGYLPVKFCGRRPHDLWCVLRFSNGTALTVTTGHPFTLSDGTIARASQLSLEDELITDTGITYPVSIVFERREAFKIPIRLAHPNVFFASSDGEHWVLTHNAGGRGTQ